MANITKRISSNLGRRSTETIGSSGSNRHPLPVTPRFMRLPMPPRTQVRLPNQHPNGTSE